MRPIDTCWPMAGESGLANKTYERSYCENERFVILLGEFEQQSLTMRLVSDDLRPRGGPNLFIFAH